MGVQDCPARDHEQMEPGTRRFHIEYTSGAAGAIPTVLTRAKGVKSIVRTGVGVIVVTMNNTYCDFVDFNGFVEQAAPAAGGACFVTVVDSLNTNPSILTCTFRTTGFAAVDPSNGDVVYLSFSALTIKL